MVKASALFVDFIAPLQSQASLEEGETAFEIIGMEMLLLRDGIDDNSFSDDSSEDSDDSSFAKDSLELERQNRRGRRANRRRANRRRASSNDGYAEDSLKLARKKTRCRRSNTAAPKDTIPFEKSIPLVFKKGSMDMKNVQPQAAFAAPDIPSLRSVRISNSAA
jgi:hypothetical protein